MNDVKLFLESCQSLVLYALVALSLGVLTASSAVALMKSVKMSAVKICRCGLLGVFLMSVMFGIGVSIGSVKVPGDPTNQVQQGQVSGEPLRRPEGWPPYHAGGLVGSRVPRDRNVGNTAYPITDEDITNCWRVAEMREGCEIVGRDAFGAPQIHEDWLVRGGFMDVMRIPAVDWSFPWRDGFLEGMTVFSDGGLRPSLRTPYFPPPFEAPLAVVPSFNWNLLPGGVSNVFWHAVSPSNSLVVTWENSPLNRNVNCITNFQAEFFADGRFAYRYDDRTVAYSRVHPLDLDFDGLPNAIDPEPEMPILPPAWNQSEAWAAVAFPSYAAEIVLAGGYAAWVMQRASDPNRRLVRLNVALQDGRRPVCIDVGFLPVMADGSSDMLYAIDCGAQVPFSLSDGATLNSVVVRRTVTPQDFQTFVYADFQTSSFPHEWNVGDVTVHLDDPHAGWIRRTPDVDIDDSELTHLRPGESAHLTAVVTNCHVDAYLGCVWHGGEGISFSNPQSLATTLTYDSSSTVQWATNNAYLVTSYAGGYSLTNAVWFTVGIENEPAVDFSISCPDVMFINDLYNGTRAERVYGVTIRLFGPHCTTGQVSIASMSGAELKLFHDEALQRPVEDPILIGISEDGAYEATTNLYLVGTTLGNGMLKADAVINGGDTRTSRASCRVIEPIRRLVTSEEVAGGGRFVNPSRLVYGTNAVLKVGVNTGLASFSPDEVKWHVVSGPGTVFPTNGLQTVLTPTADSGTVEVEARFNDDEIQPRFTLPIVRTMTINVRAFVVEPPAGQAKERWQDNAVLDRIDLANKIFTQVGVKFTLVGIEHGVGSTEDWIVRETETVIDANGRTNRVVSSQARALFSLSSTNAPEVAIFFLGDIISRKNATAFNYHKWIVVGRKASEAAPAHELGHALGLGDCYVWTAANELIVNGGKPVKRGDFSTSGQDWWRESGRGFYSIADELETIAEQMLMYGEDTANGRDIPGQWFKSLRKDTIFEDDTVEAQVGAEYIKRNPEEVYRR